MSFTETDGSKVSSWKTSLAGRYSPLLCQRWAQILHDCAPAAARRSDGARSVSHNWEADLAARVPKCSLANCVRALLPRVPDQGVARQREAVGRGLVVRTALVEAQLSAGTRRRLSAQVIGARRRKFAGANAAEPQYLRTRRITPLTQARYTKAHNFFLAYTRLRGFDLMSLANLDMALCAYFDNFFFQGKQIWEARYVVYGTIWLKQLVRHCPHTLPRAREALLGWGKAAPEVVGDPLPWEAALLIAQHMADSGTPTGLVGARAVLVGFDGYLRPAETLSIRKLDVTINRRNTVLRFPTITLTIAPQLLTPDTGDPPPRRTKAGHHDDTIIIGDAASRSAGRALVVGILRLAFQRRQRQPAPLQPRPERLPSALPVGGT